MNPSLAPLTLGLIPLDTRPVCYQWIAQLGALAKLLGIETCLPPRSVFPPSEALKHPACTDTLQAWLKEHAPSTWGLGGIVALDTLMFGGLIPSRLEASCEKTLETQWKTQWRPLLSECQGALVGVASILRIPHYNGDEEEPTYWATWGEALHDYSSQTHQSLQKTYPEPIACLEAWFHCLPSPEAVGLPAIPEAILHDFISRHKRHWKLWQRWLKEVRSDTSEDKEKKLFTRLVFSQDDTGAWGLNVLEAQALQALIKTLGYTENQAYVQTGADELLGTQMAWIISQHLQKNGLLKTPLSLSVVATHPETLTMTSRYDGISCQEVMTRQAKACHLSLQWHTSESLLQTLSESSQASVHHPPLCLLHTPSPERQGDHCGDYFEHPVTGLPKPNTRHGVAMLTKLLNELPTDTLSVWLADIAYSNGGDPALDCLLFPTASEQPNTFKPSIQGYSAWNTASNSVGSLLAWMSLWLYVTRYATTLPPAMAHTLLTQRDACHTKMYHTRVLDDLAFQALIRPTLRPLYKATSSEAHTALTELLALYAKKLHLKPPSAKLPCQRWFEIELSWEDSPSQ
ncbi:MAG: DUF4127 family protein [Vampirovibrionales bacterium]